MEYFYNHKKIIELRIARKFYLLKIHFILRIWTANNQENESREQFGQLENPSKTIFEFGNKKVYRDKSSNVESYGT